MGSLALALALDDVFRAVASLMMNPSRVQINYFEDNPAHPPSYVFPYPYARVQDHPSHLALQLAQPAVSLYDRRGPLVFPLAEA